MSVTALLNRVDSRRTSALDVDANLVITAKGSIAATIDPVTREPYTYSLRFFSTADGYAATINGGVSLTVTASSVSALAIEAENYTIKVGAYKPVLSSTLTALADSEFATGSVVSGANLQLGGINAPSAFGATFTSGVSAVNAAEGYGLILNGTLSILAREFNSSINSTVRSANAGAAAYGISADVACFSVFGNTAQLNVSATAGSKADSQEASAVGIDAQTDISGGNFAARVTATATAGTGAGEETIDASATAAGIRSNGMLSLGVISNAFAITAKSGSVAGSFASARGISFVDNAMIGGFGAGTAFNITATGFNCSEAAGIFGSGSLDIGNGLVGNWNITAIGGEFSQSDFTSRAAMIYVEGGSVSIAGDFNAVIKVSASSTKGQDAAAGGIVSGSDLYIQKQLNGSLTAEAKVTGKSTELRMTGDSQANACGLMSDSAIYFGNGFASAFRMTVTAAGIDSAEATAIDAADLSGASGPAGTWTVNATATGGQVDGGFAGDAGAAGIRAEAGDVAFSTAPGAKLTLTVNASANTLNLASIESAESGAVGIEAAGNIQLSELGLLTVTAKTGKAGGSSLATAWGLRGSSIALNSLTGMNISASADNLARAIGMEAGMEAGMGAGIGEIFPLFGVAVDAISGAYNITATATAGGAEAAGFKAEQINLGTVAAGSALTVKATGGTLAPASGGDSSATAVGIEGGITGYIPTLTVTATSGKNGETNQAAAYGIRNEFASESSIAGLRRVTVTATAADDAQAVGYQNTMLTGFDSHLESVSATSSTGDASAIGYQSFVEFSNYDLAGSLTVNARGAIAYAGGVSAAGMVDLNSEPSVQHKMTLTANAAVECAVASAISASGVNIETGLLANWTATATSTSGPASAEMLHIEGYSSDEMSGNAIRGLNGTFIANSTGKTGAEVNGFVAVNGLLTSEYRGQNLTLTGNAKSSGGEASALGISFDSIDFDSGSFRDTLLLTADAYGDAEASGIEGSMEGTVAVKTNSQFALTVTAKSATGNASALGISNSDGALDVVLAGTTNISATGGKTSDANNAYAMAYGVRGNSERKAAGYDPSSEIGPDTVAILQTLNVTAKSGSGSSSPSYMFAVACGAYCSSGSIYDTLSSFESSAQTKATIKADGVGNAAAAGVMGESMNAALNGATFAVTVLSTESFAQASGVGAHFLLRISEATMNLSVNVTGGKALVAENSANAIAFGLFAGGWNADGKLDSSSAGSLQIGSGKDRFLSASQFVVSDTKLDGTLNVNAKTVAGTVDGSRLALAAGLAANDVSGASAETFKLNVRADAADQLARAFGIQGCDGNEASNVDFNMQGNWKIAAVAATGSAIAYGIGETNSIGLQSLSQKTVLQVSAEADQLADAFGFFAGSSFSGNGNLGLAMTVTATSRKAAAVGAAGIYAVDSCLTLGGTIAVTASGGKSNAAGIFSSGSIAINGVVAAAIVKTGNAYAIRSNDESTSGLDIEVNGAIFGGKSANASAIVTQLSGLVKSGGSAAVLLSAIKPAPGSTDLYFAVRGSDFSDSLTLGGNAISVGDIDLGGGEKDVLTVSATSQVVGNVAGAEEINIRIDADPGKNPIFTVRSDASALNGDIFATVDNAQLGTYILAQGLSSDVGALNATRLVINQDTALSLGEASRELDTGAFGKLSVVTVGSVSKLVLEITYGAVGGGNGLESGNYTPPSGSSSLVLPEPEVPPAAGSGLSFEEDYRLYGVGAADLTLGGSDALFAEEQNADLLKKGLLAG